MAKQKQPKQKVAFAYVAPEAQSVQVAGDFTSWQASPLAMKKDKKGVWKTAVPLAPGKYEYRFLVDGQWRDDPGCANRQPNQFGGMNCVCMVDGAPPQR